VTATTVSLGAASLTVGILLTASRAHSYRVFTGTDTCFTPLMAGAGLALVTERLKRSTLWGSGRGIFGMVAAILLLGGAVGGPDGLRQPVYAWMLLVSIASAVLIAALLDERPKFAIGRCLAHPSLRSVGRVSYALYLWHFPIFQLSQSRWGESSARALTAGWTASFVLAFLTDGFVAPFLAQRMLRWSRRVSGSERRQPVARRPRSKAKGCEKKWRGSR
jgi:peptidoglycan/LPS O-acetylase OafA/YrhL